MPTFAYNTTSHNLRYDKFQWLTWNSWFIRAMSGLWNKKVFFAFLRKYLNSSVPPSLILEFLASSHLFRYGLCAVLHHWNYRHLHRTNDIMWMIMICHNVRWAGLWRSTTMYFTRLPVCGVRNPRPWLAVSPIFIDSNQQLQMYCHCPMP
jgi:hypothetical protein